MLIGISIALATAAAISHVGGPPAGEDLVVQIARRDADHRVDVAIDGRPFTSYIYPATLKKPALFPIRSAAGALVTRGFPLDPRPRERVDHPHHVGLWFNHGDVNGLDFWNNSDAVTGERAAKMGTIRHRAIVEAKGGSDRGDLIVESAWMRPDGAVLLVERTHYVFRGAATTRTIDRVATLTAQAEPVVFRDSKEGALGLRVARELEHPATKPEVYTDAAGRPSQVPVLDNTGVTGEYIGSDGRKGDAVWGTRGPWMMLAGTVDGRQVTVAMLDHPSNPNFPGYWHARGYGLFALNPLGRRSYDEKAPELTFRLEPKQSVVFRHRVLVADGPLSATDLRREHAAFAAIH